MILRNAHHYDSTKTTERAFRKTRKTFLANIKSTQFGKIEFSKDFVENIFFF